MMLPLLSGVAVGQTAPAPELFEVLGDPNMPLTANSLVSVCSSNKPDWQAYCEGYIEGSMHFWKTGNACASRDPRDQSFCAGARAAREKVQALNEACNDCSLDSFASDDRTEDTLMALYMERMRRFTAELESALGTCKPDKQQDEFYCMGYNAVVANSLAERLSIFEGDSVSTRVLARGTTQVDLFAHLFADQAFYATTPCISIQANPQDALDMMLQFVRDHPEQQEDTTAIMLLAKALFYRDCPGPAKQLRPHMEQCTNWTYDSGGLGTVNTCDDAVFIQFLVPGQPLVERTLKPGQAYNSGITREQISGAWVFTTCPIGHVSAVAVSPDNRQLIRSSGYSCVKK